MTEQNGKAAERIHLNKKDKTQFIGHSLSNKKIMKKYIYSIMVAMLALAGFTACSSDDDNIEPGTWDAAENYANIYFEEDSKTEMIDPADPTTTTFTVSRRNTSGPLTVTFKELENTSNAFKVGQAVFADGEETATVDVTFADAAIGDPHTLKVTVEGSDLVSAYSSDIVYTYTVTRVKWNAIGKAKYRDDFVFEDQWEVDVLQRDDDNSYYRILDPYGVWAEDLDGNQTDVLELHVTKKGDVINGITMTEAGVVDWYRINTGYFHPTYEADIYALHPQNFTSESLNTAAVYANSKVSGYLPDGKTPGQIQLAPYWYMFGVGGWNYTTEPTIFINLPGFVEQYEATIDEDFEWEDVYTGEFQSKQLGTTFSATLQKGVCQTTTDDCDKVFEETYGTPYKIVNAYADGTEIVFCAKGKKVIPAPDYEDPQPLGIKALGEDVYALINTEGSSFGEDGTVTLNLTFVNADESVTYGTSEETLFNITYSQVGTGTYTYAQMWTGDDPDLVIDKRDDRDDTYRIENWGGGVNFYFTWDKVTNKVNVPEQFTGYTHATYGDVYVLESTEYNPTWTDDDGWSYYDPETSTFHFAVAYVVDAGYFGHGEELFVANFDASAAKSTAKKAPQIGRWAMTKSIQYKPSFGFYPAKNYKAVSKKNQPLAHDTLVAE